jgi:hypothetical protein
MPAVEPIFTQISASTSPTVTSPSSPTPTVISPSDQNLASLADIDKNNQDEKKRASDATAVVEIRPEDVEAQRESGSQNQDELALSIPAPDTSRDAWLFLAACFMMEAMVWGKLLLRIWIYMCECVLIRCDQASHLPLASFKTTTALTSHLKAHPRRPL